MFKPSQKMTLKEAVVYCLNTLQTGADYVTTQGFQEGVTYHVMGVWDMDTLSVNVQTGIPSLPIPGA